MKAGVAISPDTPSTSISDEVGELADLLLVMTVYPGAGFFILFFSLPFLTL
jgi:ribulose-phosphate 3-epimerase